MSGATYRYEILEQVEGRWSIRYECETDREAMEQAFLVLAEDDRESVRIIQYTTMPGSGRTFNKTIFHQGKDAQGDGPTQLSGTCETAHICENGYDLLKLPAREIMNTLFREYLDEAMLTPTEVLHSTAHLRTLDNAGNLCLQGIGVVAVAQMKQHGGALSDRQKQLNDFLSDHKKVITAIEKDTDNIQKIAAGQLFEYGSKIRSLPNTSEDLRLAYLGVSIAQTIANASGWEGKLSALLALIGPVEDAHTEDLRAIDRFVSDILSGGQGVKEILGAQATLGDALLAISNLCAGTLDAKKFMPDSLIQLNALFSEHPLKGTKSVLTGRVTRELKSGKRLTKDASNKEIDALIALLKVLSSVKGGLKEDAKLRSAAEHRSRQQIPAEIYRIYEFVSDPLERVKRLIKLGKRVYGVEGYGVIVVAIRDIALFPGTIEKWLKEQRTVLDKMRLLTTIHSKVSAFPIKMPEKDQLLTHLDDVCFDLMTQANLLQSVEAQTDDVVEKTNKLLLLAQSGTFPNGRTMDALRKRVLGYTHQQGFLKAYTAHAKSEDEATQILAEFRQLLQDAGIV